MGLFDHFPYTNVHELNLDWILKLMRELDSHVEQLEEWQKTHEEQYEELKAFMNSINSGRLPESMIIAMKDWLSVNALDIIGELATTVFFGITDDGYFYAEVPNSWNDITFRTSGLDIFITGVDYGHLVLEY